MIKCLRNTCLCLYCRDCNKRDINIQNQIEDNETMTYIKNILGVTTTQVTNPSKDVSIVDNNKHVEILDENAVSSEPSPITIVSTKISREPENKDKKYENDENDENDEWYSVEHIDTIT